MMDLELDQTERSQTFWRGDMPCLVLRSNSSGASRNQSIVIGDEFRLPADLIEVREGMQRSGLLLPLGWREYLELADPVTSPVPVASDDWEEDDDVVDDDDDDDEEEDEDEDDDDFFPDDADEFEDEDEEEDDDEDEDE